MFHDALVPFAERRIITMDLVNNFHSKNSFLSKIKEAIGCFITRLKSG